MKEGRKVGTRREKLVKRETTGEEKWTGREKCRGKMHDGMSKW